MGLSKLAGCLALQCSGRSSASTPRATSRAAPRAARAARAASPEPQPMEAADADSDGDCSARDTESTRTSSSRSCDDFAPEDARTSSSESCGDFARAEGGSIEAEDRRTSQRARTSSSKSCSNFVLEEDGSASAPQGRGRGRPGGRVASAAAAVLAAVRLRRALSSRRARAEASEESEAEAAKIRELMALREPGQPLGGLSDFAKAYGDEAFCRRLLKKNRGDARKSAQGYAQALRWREEKKELLLSWKFVQGGDYRVIGADLQRRPLCYCCARNQWLPTSQCVDQIIVSNLQAIRNLPDGMNETTHIWDLHGLILRYNLNPTALMHIAQTIEGYFAGRLHQVIIVDLPRMAAFLKDAVWPLLPEKTKNKVLFMTAQQAKEHLRHSCDTEVYGRIAAAMDQNRNSRTSLEERKAAWNRVDEHGLLVPLSS